MPRHAKLPEPLAWLQPFANRLSHLPIDALHEDIDPEPLIAAVQQHFDPNDPDSAARFRSDVKLLEDWLEASGGPAHPAHWIVGFLATCELQDLFEDVLKTPLPKVEMSCPPSWKVEASPASLALRKGGVVASFTAIENDAWEHLQHQYRAARQTPPPDPNTVMQQMQQVLAQASASQGSPAPLLNIPRMEVTEDHAEVRFGVVFGQRHTRTQTAPFPWKTVTYLLTAPGGRIMGQISTLKPGTFDEAPIESVLATLRVAPPALPMTNP
jgi:hypothetical protein